MTRTLTALAVGAAMVVALAGCGTDSDTQQYQGVCVDPNTQVRLDDSQCPGGQNGGGGNGGGMGVMEWVLLSQALGSNNQPVYIAPVGQRIEHIHTYRTVPAGGRVNAAPVPKSGGYASFSGSGQASWSKTKPTANWAVPPAPGSRPDPKPTRSGLWSRIKGGSGGSGSGGYKAPSVRRRP